MKRRVITHTVTELDDDHAWAMYLANVARAYPQGRSVAHNIATHGNNTITSEGPGMRVTTTHTVELGVEQESNAGIAAIAGEALLACSRAGCSEPRWTETDHLCAGHAREAQELANASRPAGVSCFNCTPCEDGDKTPVGLTCVVCGAKGRVE